MKKILKVTSLLLLCMLFVGISTADAQYGKKKKKKKKSDDQEYFDESGGFKHKLWYGGGFNLGFSGGNTQSVFNFGISPMVGYKITEQLSIGPRAVLDYSTYKISQFGEVFRANTLSYGGGVFARGKIFQSLFLHTEFELLNEPFFVGDPNGNFFLVDNDNKLITVRETSNNFYIGGGYYSGGGGGLGYEIVLLYNLLEPEDSLNLPIALRFGFTWNF